MGTVTQILKRSMQVIAGAAVISMMLAVPAQIYGSAPQGTSAAAKTEDGKENSSFEEAMDLRHREHRQLLRQKTGKRTLLLKRQSRLFIRIRAALPTNRFSRPRGTLFLIQMRWNLH